MAVVLRVICYNIAEGNLTGGVPDNSKLTRLAEVIRGLCPDIVFLNEVRNERGWPVGNGVNQVEYLSDHSGLPHRHWGNTTALGLRGHKAVGVLSRYPLEAALMHPVMHNGSETVKYGGTFKFRHCATGMVLHSHSYNYGHAGSSGQQQVTGYSHLDDNNWWRVK